MPWGLMYPEVKTIFLQVRQAPERNTQNHTVPFPYFLSNVRNVQSGDVLCPLSEWWLLIVLLRMIIIGDCKTLVILGFDQQSLSIHRIKHCTDGFSPEWAMSPFRQGSNDVVRLVQTHLKSLFQIQLYTEARVTLPASIQVKLLFCCMGGSVKDSARQNISFYSQQNCLAPGHWGWLQGMNFPPLEMDPLRAHCFQFLKPVLKLPQFPCICF